jgi:hypothetical protein
MRISLNDFTQGKDAQALAYGSTGFLLNLFGASQKNELPPGGRDATTRCAGFSANLLIEIFFA